MTKKKYRAGKGFQKRGELWAFYEWHSTWYIWAGQLVYEPHGNTNWGKPGNPGIFLDHIVRWQGYMSTLLMSTPTRHVAIHPGRGGEGPPTWFRYFQNQPPNFPQRNSLSHVSAVRFMANIENCKASSRGYLGNKLH